MTAPIKTAVIVPSFNRPDRLRRCLQALTALDPAADEIVVVDDGSAEPLAPVCAGLPRVRCLRQPNRGPAAARNAGVAATGAAFLAFTDDDCRPHPGWLGALMAAQGGDPGRLVGGRVRDVARGLCAAASQTLSEYLYAAGDAAGGNAEFFTTNNLGLARAGFERLGGFDEGFPLAAGEDRDFGRRWRASGGSLVLAPDALVDHAHEMGLRQFWRQHANYGRGARLLDERAVPGARGGNRLRFYGALVAHPLRDGGARPIARAALLALSQVATAQGYVAQVRTPRGPRCPQDGSPPR